MEKKYPKDLFWIGFITNIFGRFFFLFFPTVVLLIIGIWNKTCLVIGVFLLLIDVIVSFIEQIRIRKATLESNNPNFDEFQEAILSDNWRDNIKDIVDEKIEDNDDLTE